jgi:DNA-binding SARP family transcriptional activator
VLFILLLSRVDQLVATDTLIEELWSGAPPPVAKASLRAYVANLRRVLEPDRPPRAPTTLLRTRGQSYLLDSRGVEFDARQFTEHAAAGRQALGRTDSERALVEFDAALGLWRGEAYSDVRDADWAAAEIARLEELRLSVVEDRCAARLALGEHHGVVAELESHVRAHPLREYGCELLMLALYRAGRQAEALGVLRSVRAQLAEELGIDPGAALQRLEHDILTQDPVLDWHPMQPISAGRLTPVEPSAPVQSASADELGVAESLRVVSTRLQGLSVVIGRETELAALRAGFTDPGRTGSPRRTGSPERAGRPVWRVLTGLGGVGKTSLARAYAQRYQEQYGLVWWVRAEDPEAVAGEFRALLDILAPQYAEHARDPVQAVHALLANRTTPWLLIIDNITEPAALQGLLPAAGLGDVLVTSRAGTWPDRRRVLPVAPLTQPHAVRLITSLSDDADAESAAVLADELGGLPLALAQAGCYVAHSALDLASYLALYRSRRAELHQRGPVPDYPATVATTWRLAFDQLSPAARALLNLLAWYAPDTIPLDRLLSPLSDPPPVPEPVATQLGPLLSDALQRHQAITELVSYGLLTRVAASGSVTVHRLVQAVTTDQLTAEGHQCVWIKAAAVLLSAACPHWSATPFTTTSWQGLPTHLRAVIEHLQPTQPITLDLRHHLAGWTGETGDNERARELTAAVVEDMTRVLGPDHPHTLAARIDLAYWTGQAEDLGRARDLAAAVVEDTTRVLGPDHQHTLYARGGLVRWTALAGDVARARDLSARIAEDTQRILGPDHRTTLIARCHLARWTGEAGDTALARDLATAVVTDDERVLGPEDRDTLAARAYLIRWTGEAGDPTQARDLATTLVEDDERILGSDHRHTLLARSYLIRWTGEAGDPHRARDLATTLVEDTQRIFTPDHKYTVLAHGMLTHWTRQDNDDHQDQ